MAVAVALVVMIVLSSTGVLPRAIVSLLTRIAYSIILAVSLNLVVGFLGELSLGHAGFMCVGAYIGCFFANYLHTIIDSPLLILVVSMLVGGVVAAIFGFIIGLPALRLKGDYLAIATLAFGEIVRNIFKNLPYFGGALGLNTVTFKAKHLFIVAFIMVLFVLIVLQNLIRSKHGRAITAIRDNEIAAKAMGINVTFYKLFVFILAAFCAGIAGVLYGHLNTPVLYSFFSYNYSIEILVMVVLGGMGNISGSIIAAVLITYVNFVLQNELSGDLAALKLLIYALILIAAVLFNNAPIFRPIKEKLDFAKLFKSKQKPEKIKDDDAEWDRITTKIQMDELLSLDVKPNASVPDKPRKEEK
ncbi:MAG: branched-chain amino acid ABC transporter permease [Clostridia bacterium]|nr:branched-chain amino acid ABC transporter permease [Clostridia bacterium]